MALDSVYIFANSIYEAFCVCGYILFSISLRFNRDQPSKATNNVHLGGQLKLALEEFPVLRLLACI